MLTDHHLGFSKCINMLLPDYEISSIQFPSVDQFFSIATMIFNAWVAVILVVSVLAHDSHGFCQTEGQTCNVMNGRTCCNGLMCESGIGNTRICRRNIGGGVGCRLRNEECKINGINAMKCCGSLRCMPGIMNKMTCQ